MNVLDVLLDPASWRGRAGLAHLLLVHVGVAGLALALACVLALPAAVLVGHRRPGVPPRARPGARAAALATTGGRAVPVVALAAVLLLLLPPVAGGAPAVVLAVSVLCAPPLFAAAVAAVGVVEPAAVEAARAAGAGEGHLVRAVELPLAAPAVVAGVRRAAAQALGATALAGLLGGPGLGAGMAQGIATGEAVRYLPAAVVLALTGLITAGLLTLVQRGADPRRRGERARPRRPPLARPDLLAG